MKIVAIIQARMGSSRLPGKVLKKIKQKTILSHVLNRIAQSKNIDCIVVATTTQKIDDQIVSEVNKHGFNVYRGSEDNVLDRFYQTAVAYSADVIIRITSDCPLIDPEIIDKMVHFYIKNNYSLVTNAGSEMSKRTFPRGLDVEIFSMDVLKKAFHQAKLSYQKEHVTPFIYEKNNNIYYYTNKENLSQHRWTLDTEEDFQLIKKIYNEMYSGEHNFYMGDIVQLFNRNPELFNINAHIEQKKVK
ncbi:glycosyltransferase family protein [Gracilibacillus caseinilyticus]|uniref:Glycosyltransferase family protein n=1 Tax=Gracilibacillus caseinilyticus TaxID=2932256 RepID=A0ABY4EVN0_9BACI|nr:glycosyltransferase family protein [Gracilibacillus caseinilyticus]UOQ48298.1 glycosyltransferase family protein [Gracilibacillus caseinilyticus]